MKLYFFQLLFLGSFFRFPLNLCRPSFLRTGLWLILPCIRHVFFRLLVCLSICLFVYDFAKQIVFIFHFRFQFKKNIAGDDLFYYTFSTGNREFQNNFFVTICIKTTKKKFVKLNATILLYATCVCAFLCVREKDIKHDI